MSARFAGFVCVCILFAAFPCLAQWPRPTASATRAPGPIRIDGRLTEPAWKSWTWNTGFTSAGNSAENRGAPKPATVQTRFKVLYDATGLIVAVECDEPNPAGIRAAITAHDGTVWADDCVEIFFDPAGKGRYYHHFLINSKGAWYDDYSADFGLVHGKLWDCAIETAATVDAAARKWTVEVRIPFGGLNLPARPGEKWLWNITRERHAGGRLELSSWSPLKGNFHTPKRFGHLAGVTVDFQPFALRVGTPKTVVSRAPSGLNTLSISTAVENRTGADRTVTAFAMIFGRPETRVTAPLSTIPNGEKGFVTFPALKVRASLPEARVLLEFTDAKTGLLCKSVVQKVNADYRPLGIALIKPCYRHNIYASQTLNALVFKLSLAPDVQARTVRVRCELRSQGNRAVVRAVELSPASAQQDSVRLPIPGLEIGRYDLIATALDRTGAVAASATVAVRNLPPPPAGNEVRIDRFGNVLVNGKPFLGIGWYGGVPIEDPRPDVVALQNLTTPVVITPPDVSSISMKFKSHGIYSIVSVENGRLYFSFNLWRDKKKGTQIREEIRQLSEPSALTRDCLRRLVAAVRNEPGLLGYYIADEPEIHNTRSDYLENTYKFLAELDPYHPVMVTNDTLDGIVTHGHRCADILNPDPYSSNLEYAPNFMKRCREVIGPGQAIMLTPWQSSSQAHTTADYGTAPPYPWRVTRNQYLVSLAFGARGWTGYTSAFFMPEIELRYGLPHVWRELRFLESAIGAPPPDTPLRIKTAAGMAGWVRAVNGRVYLVLVNYKPGKRTATVRHPLLRDVHELIVVSEGRRVPVRNGAFQDGFAEGAAHIYTTDPRGAELETLAAVDEDIAKRKRAAAKPGNLLYVGRGVRASASKGFYAPWFDQYYYYAINGITDDLGWYASHAGGKPASLELILPRPAAIGRVRIYTPNLADYALSFRAADGSVRRARFTGNTQTIIEHSFRPPVPCLKLRITATKAHPMADGSKRAPQVSEIEAYAEPGPEHPTPVEIADASTAPIKSPIPLSPDATRNALWMDDFRNFAPRDKYYWKGKDTHWVRHPRTFKAVKRAGGGIECCSIAPKGGAGMTHIFPYDSAYRFFQVKIAGIQGKGYRFTNVGFASSSGKPGYRGAVNTSRPGIYTVDTHYVHDSFRTGKAKTCFITVYVGSPRFDFDWVRLVRRPVNGLAVMLADGRPLPKVLKPGDELLFHLILEKPAVDAVVDVMTGSSYKPLPINGEPTIQLRSPQPGASGAERAGTEWLARVKLGPGTGTFDQSRTGYPVVFRARITGGGIQETYASAFVGMGE